MDGRENIIRPLSLEEVHRFLTVKTKGDQCFSCGEIQWVLTGYGSFNTFTLLPYGHADDIGTNATSILTTVAKPVLTMICANCGFIRQHDLYRITKWLGENPPEATHG